MNKKTVLPFAIVASGMITSVNFAKAQEGFHLGIQGQPQLSWLVNQDDDENRNFEPRTTFNSSYGISAQYGLTAEMGIGLNVVYSFQGQRYRLNGIERVKKVEYLKIPILFVYNFEITDRIYFIGKAGPQVALNTKALLTDKDGNEIISDHMQAYEDIDFSVVISVGIGCEIYDNLYLDAALRFDYGFTNAEDKDYHHNINDPFSAANGSFSSARAVTYNATGGLNIGLRYCFVKQPLSYHLNFK